MSGAHNPQSGRNIAVTGGSGQLGRLVVRRLLQRPDIDKVVCVDRAPPRIASARLEFIRADVRDENLARHFAGCDTVVHCAFLVTANAPADVFRSVNIEGSKNVFRAAVAAGAEGIVYISSILAYGSVHGHPVPITEDTPRVHQPAFPYAACKFEIEAFLDRFESEHPAVAISRLRPNVLLGRAVPHALGLLLRKGQIPPNGGAPLWIVSDEDVADLVLLAIDQRARGAFNAAADPRTADELIEEFGMRKVWAPKPLVLGYAVLDRALKKIGLHLPYDSSWFVCTEGVVLVNSSERAKRELGWSPRYPTASAVLRRFREIAPRRLDRRLALALRLIAREGRRHLPAPASVHLCISGEYGADCSVVVTDGKLSIRRGAPEFPASAIFVSAALLGRLLAGEADVERACQTGDLSLEGNADGRRILDWMVATFACLRARAGVAATIARLLTRALKTETSSLPVWMRWARR
jgi:nucleoside-diphosphate-sugar epimerase